MFAIFDLKAFPTLLLTALYNIYVCIYVLLCICSRSSLSSPPTGSSSLSLSSSSSSLLAGDVTLMLLAVVAFAADELQQRDRANALLILKNICVKGITYMYIHTYIHTYTHI